MAGWQHYNHPREWFVTVLSVKSPRHRRHDEDPYAVLGLRAGAGEAEIVAARRRLAKAAHPDAGGSVARMQRLNDAAERALATVRSPTDRPPTSERRPPPSYRGGALRHDHPSFTIEALPVEAFEGLLIAAASLGEVVDDDPPYLLEVLLGQPAPAWCRLQLVPEAGAASVSLTVASVPGSPMPDVDEVRDRWIAALNQLDWSDLDRSRPPP